MYISISQKRKKNGRKTILGRKEAGEQFRLAALVLQTSQIWLSVPCPAAHNQPFVIPALRSKGYSTSGL